MQSEKNMLHVALTREKLLQKMGICRMALSFSVEGFVQSKLVAYRLQVLNLTPNKTNWDMAEI